MAPRPKMPIADILLTDLNSFDDGFLNTFHTRTDCKKNDLNFAYIIALEDACF